MPEEESVINHLVASRSNRLYADMILFAAENPNGISLDELINKLTQDTGRAILVAEGIFTPKDFGQQADILCIFGILEQTPQQIYRLTQLAKKHLRYLTSDDWLKEEA